MIVTSENGEIISFSLELIEKLDEISVPLNGSYIIELDQDLKQIQSIEINGK